MPEYKIVNATQLDADLQRLCDSIRSRADGTIVGKIIFPTDMEDALNMMSVSIADRSYSEGYTNGYNEGKAEGGNTEESYNEGYEAARLYAAQQAQNFGVKTSYGYWKHQQDITGLLIPYPMAPTQGSYLFSNTYTTDGSLIDLRNYDIDFSQCASFNYFLNLAKINAIGTLDTSSCSDLATLLYNANQLETIEHLILKEDGSQKLGNNFGLQCAKLKYINKITGQFGSSFRIFHNNSLLIY